MKKLTMKTAVLCLMLMSSAATSAQSLQDILSGITGAASSQQDGSSDLISGLTSIFSSKKNATESSILGNWSYTEPAIILSSDNVLTNVAAKAASKKIESKLQTHLTKYGIKPGSMSITFDKNGKFVEKLGKKTVNGTWKIDNGQLVISYGTIKPVSITTQIDGKNLMIVTNASKLLGLMKALGAKSTNSTISTVTSLMKNVNGMQCGLTFVKKQ